MAITQNQIHLRRCSDPQRVDLKFRGPAFDDLRESLKVWISPSLRRYQSEDKAWCIRRTAHLDDWLDYCQREFDAVVFDDEHEPEERRKRAERPPTLASAYAALFLTERAPIELVRVARKVLARLYHPDQGGNHDAMIRVNNAADEILRRTA